MFSRILSALWCALFIPRGCRINPYDALIISRLGLKWSPGMNRSLYLTKEWTSFKKSNKPYMMSFVVSTLYLAFVQGPTRSWLWERALAPRPFWPHFRGKFVFSSDYVFVRIELCAAIVEFAP